MKSILSFIFCCAISYNAIAADLTATTTPSAKGKKTGTIALVVTGGFAPYTYSWTGPSGYTSTKMNPDSLAAGTYCVTVTDQYCGTATSCFTVSESSNGITEVATNNWSIYPNPFAQQININFNNTLTGKVQLTLIDALGKAVATQQADATQIIEWNLSNSLASGMYILQVKTATSEQFQKQLIHLKK